MSTLYNTKKKPFFVGIYLYISALVKLAQQDAGIFGDQVAEHRKFFLQHRWKIPEQIEWQGVDQGARGVRVQLEDRPYRCFVVQMAF